ncbi:unnamed protein product [Gulo gulo]|uniref:Uncharacterized protein n=1 Tax=Gulo gulo TaxID=48420 RepID=A0A9X9M2P9_GULGU|nr:unnamed protein product [Gulo gulo]
MDSNHSISTVLLLSLCFFSFPSTKHSFYLYITVSSLIVFLHLSHSILFFLCNENISWVHFSSMFICTYITIP